MKLIPAYGSSEMYEALASIYVRKIVNFLYQCLESDMDFFKQAALFLRNNHKQVSQYASASFTQKLQALLDRQNRPDADGNLPTSPYIDDLFQVIAEMYQQDQTKLNFQRGVIVELLTWKLVSSRCNMGECLNNHRLVDYNFNSRQIDVAVLALRLRQIEGYSCKINPHQLEEKDCTNLTSLSDYGLNKGFSTYLGVVGFNHTEVARQKLKALERTPYEFTASIKAYGLNNMHELKNPPYRYRLQE
jgi:hypothetical protein